MSRHCWEENLARLQSRLDEYAKTNGLVATGSIFKKCGSLSQSLYLAHSTADAKFSRVCESNRLCSPQRLHAEGIKPLATDSVEATLGTANSVFFYAAPFRFPHTGCGFLFNHRLEQAHRDDGVAVPFDSGGLVNVFTRPNPAESAVEFLARHELPLPEHRDYLRKSLEQLFAHPLDYLNGNDPRHPGPIGLTGGDRRRWTHEVRLPDQVYVKTGWLQALFIPVSRVADAPIQKMLRWCEHQGIDIESFHGSRENDFETLLRACVDYIHRKLL